MRNLAASTLAFVGGFVLMALEVIGARYLAKDFGGSFYVWISQIGVVLIALALGYYIGGTLADRCQRLFVLGGLLVPSGVLTCLIPNFSSHLITALILSHPADRDIPILWQKLDPVLGSSLVFLLPCFGLATLSPYLIRLSAKSLAQVGRTSGLIIAASTVGSIAGVFVSGYILIDHLNAPDIFRVTGALTVLLGLSCFFMDKWMRRGNDQAPMTSRNDQAPMTKLQ